MKRLIICLDGTWMRPTRGHRSTHAVNLMRALEHKDSDGTPQVIYYGRGVGAYDSPLTKYWGGATGAGLEEDIKDAYVFLGNNHQVGDEIYLFGFSRGAYTARSLAGFIQAAGLLDRYRLGRLGKAWDFYRTPPRKRRKEDNPGGKEVEIECLGVWDTVGARGIPVRWFAPAQWYRRRRHGFHDVSLGPQVRCALQALAVDEKRAPFKPVLWERPKTAAPPAGQIVEQVWFAGCHADIGGGVGPKDGTREEIEEHSGLPDLAFEWMVQRVQEHTRLHFRDDWHRQNRTIRGDPLAPAHESRAFPAGIPYVMSWPLPYQRVIYEADGWTRRIFRSRNKPGKGHEFINEQLHASVLERLGRYPRGTKRAYTPENVKAAREKGVPEAGWAPQEQDEKEDRTSSPKKVSLTH